MTEQYVNNASSTLDGTITDSVTSLDVISAATFPPSGNFRIRVGTEIMLVTAVTGNTFTVTRGEEGTTATAHSDGAAVVHVLTAESLATIISETGGSLADHDHTGAGDGGVLTNDEHDGYSLYAEISTPSTPASGKVAVYPKSDHKLYIKDSTGTETDLTATGGGGSLTSATADVTTDESTTSTSYTNLTTTGPAVTLSPGGTQAHLLWWKCWTWNGTNNARGAMSLAIAGATAVDADSGVGASPGTQDETASSHVLALAQSNGATHTTKYRSVDGTTAHFRFRRLTGIAV